MLLKVRISLLLLVATATLTAVCAAAWQQPKPVKNLASTAPPPQQTVFAAYRTWRRVNPKPVMMDAAVAMRCDMRTTDEEAKRTANSPHFPKYITVYVNRAGQDAMLHERIPHFPAGTVIVKEKRTLPGDKTPELMTVMTKQPAGYDSAHGDWEYAVMDAHGKIEAQGKLAKCQNCHDQKKNVDYVFKGYIPEMSHTLDQL
jgi:hypothetical protein